jgi:hypothetical protein
MLLRQPHRYRAQHIAAILRNEGSRADPAEVLSAL